MTWPRVFSRNWIGTTLLALAGVGLCIRLGIWQLDRLAQRQAFNAHVQAMEAMPVLQLPTTQDLEIQEYRRVRVRGVFDEKRQVAIRNQAHEGQYGYRLFSPLLIDESELGPGVTELAVLVDRGWIPAEDNEQPDSWRKYHVSGAVEVEGVIRLGQTKPAFGGIVQPTAAPGAAGTAYWMYADVTGIGHQLPYAILPVYVQLDSSLSPGQEPVASTPELELTEGPHRGYAMQWFAFAAMLLIGYPIYVNRREQVRL